MATARDLFGRAFEFLGRIGSLFDDSGPVVGTGGGGSLEAGGPAVGRGSERVTPKLFRSQQFSLLTRIQEIEAQAEQNALRAQQQIQRSVDALRRPSLFTILSQSQRQQPILFSPARRMGQSRG